MKSRFTTVLWILTVLFCVVLVTDVVPWLRGIEPWLPGDLSWEWLYGAPRWLWLFLSILGVIIYVFGVIRLLDRYKDTDTRYPVHLILWTFVGSTLITLLIMAIEGQPLFLLFTRSASRVTGGYLYASVIMGDLGQVLRHWPEFASTYQRIWWINSVTTSPPGHGTLYYATTQAFAAMPPVADAFGSLLRPLECQDQFLMMWSNAQLASAWPQMFMPLWASLAVAPLYNVGVIVFSHKIARQAVALWGLTPGLILFSPRFNVFYPLVAVMILSLLWRGLICNRWLPIALAGFALGVTAFLNLAIVPIGVLAGLTIFGWGLLDKARWREALRGLIVFGVGAAAFWIIYAVLSGLTIFEILRTIFGFHFAVINRPYWPWIIQHPLDMFLFVGLPMSALIFWRAWILIKQRKLLSRTDVFVGAALLTLIATDLSGINQGETGRIWLIFAPAWHLLAADILLRLERRNRLAILVMQAMVLLSMGAVLRVHFTGFTVPITAETAQSGPQFPVNSQFVRGNDKVTFVGLDVEKATTSVILHIHWRADSLVSKPYYLGLAPVPPDKSFSPGMTWNPQKWVYPPSCWKPGQEFVDTVNVPLGDHPQPGNWLFSVSITDFYTHESMKMAGQDSSQVGIGPVNVPAQQ